MEVPKKKSYNTGKGYSVKFYADMNPKGKANVSHGSKGRDPNPGKGKC